MATFSKYRKKNGRISYTAQIRIKRNGKIVHSESFTAPNLTMAKAWANKREVELSEPGAIDALSCSVTVGGVLQWYYEFSEGAGRTKSSTLLFLIGQDISALDAVKLTVDDCLIHAKDRRPASPATILQDFIWLRLAMKSYKLAKGAPVAAQSLEDAITLLRASRAIASPKWRTRRPEIHELNAIIEYFTNARYRCQLPMVDIILFAVFSARRAAEITRIAPVDRDGDRILVRDMKHPGGVRDTWVFLTDEAMAILDRQPKAALYFPYNERSTGAAFRRACKFLEIKDLRFHDLRHEGASWLFEQGMDIPRVAGITGHQSWGSLQRYTHLRDRGVKDKYLNWEWRPSLGDAE